MDTCGICDRLLGDINVDEHHLIPKTFKGKEKYRVHRICHTKLHSVFTERELLHYYHTFERIREHSEMQKFIKWVQNKDPGFYDKNKETRVRNGKRKR
jgi:hypothetical protein